MLTHCPVANPTPVPTSFTPTIDKSDDRIRRMFAAIAHKYDRMNHLLSFQVDRLWRRATVRRVFPVNERPILDCCTGTGDLALAYARATNGRIPIFGTDFCPEMLDLAKGKSATRGSTSGITWLEADTLDLPFPDGNFQIVTVAFGIRNVSDTNRGLQEMVRVCQPGGRIAILEFSMPTLPPIRAAYQWYFRNILPRVGQYLARNDKDAYDYLPASVSEFPQGESFAERMRLAGCSHVHYYPLTCGIATLYVGSKAKGLPVADR